MPKTFNGQLVDEWIRIGDAESFQTARMLARREGILCGGSSGTTWPRLCVTPAGWARASGGRSAATPAAII